MLQGIQCQQKGYILRGKISDPSGMAKLSFELEVCRIPNLNVVGIRRKRFVIVRFLPSLYTTYIRSTTNIGKILPRGLRMDTSDLQKNVKDSGPESLANKTDSSKHRLKGLRLKCGTLMLDFICSHCYRCGIKHGLYSSSHNSCINLSSSHNSCINLT